MAYTGLIFGNSGEGKTTSYRNVDPKSTVVVDADRKGGFLPWKGAKKNFNDDNQNFFKLNTVGEIYKLMKDVNDSRPEVNLFIVDGINSMMVDDEFRRMRSKEGFQGWQELAYYIWSLVSNASQMRDDLTIFFIGHSQTDYTEDGYTFTKLKTSGRKLEKICLESKFNVVLLARHLDDGRYIFETQSNKSTAKSPMGMFDSPIIDNDLNFVVNQMKNYWEGD